MPSPSCGGMVQRGWEVRGAAYQFVTQPPHPMGVKAHCWRGTLMRCCAQSWCKVVRFPLSIVLLTELLRGWRDGPRSWSRVVQLLTPESFPKIFVTRILMSPWVSKRVENSSWMATAFKLGCNSLICCHPSWLSAVCLLQTLMDTSALLNDKQVVCID